MRRMPDPVLDHFREQAAACRRLGSPFTADLCDLLGERLDDGCRFGARVVAWPSDARRDALALRACAALHALARSGRAGALAAVYPPRPADPDGRWAAIRAAVAAHDDFLHNYLDSPPQTNEVARSAVLLGGAFAILAATGLPLAWFEIGASMWLNLGFDRHRYDLGALSWGPEDARVRCDWTGAPPGLDGAPPAVVERAGCDRNPLDPSDPADRERLLSYVWADQAERIGRIEAAIDAAAAGPVRVEAADAADWVERRIAAFPAAGRTFVLAHTVVWQYLPSATRGRVERAMAEAGGRATARAPVAWLRMEGDGDPGSAALDLTLWPGGGGGGSAGPTSTAGGRAGPRPEGGPPPRSRRRRAPPGSHGRDRRKGQLQRPVRRQVVRVDLAGAVERDAQDRVDRRALARQRQQEPLARHRAVDVEVDRAEDVPDRGPVDHAPVARGDDRVHAGLEHLAQEAAAQVLPVRLVDRLPGEPVAEVPGGGRVLADPGEGQGPGEVDRVHVAPRRHRPPAAPPEPVGREPAQARVPDVVECGRKLHRATLPRLR
jgi:hypothetical protein